MAKDLSRKQFEAALRENGFTGPQGPFLYWTRLIGEGPSSVSVSELNGGPRLRTKLAYMLIAAKEEEQR